MITENQAQSSGEGTVEHFGGSELDHVKRVDRAIRWQKSRLPSVASVGDSIAKVMACQNGSLSGEAGKSYKLGSRAF